MVVNGCIGRRCIGDILQAIRQGQFVSKNRQGQFVSKKAQLVLMV
jgi:hypothetical protein